jgi:hypothetical protein
VFNPPASHLELKAMLGVLSAAAADDPLARRFVLAEPERDAVARRVPWTRVLRRGPGTGPDGSAQRDLLDFARAHPAELVVKRSWDYGGRGVFLGAELDDKSTQTKLSELLGPRPRPYDWHELLAHIERSDEAWVVQALIDVAPRPLVRVDDVGPVEHLLYSDLSSFTSLGTCVAVTGGAVRASRSRIVNIQGGGGLAPLLRGAAISKILA